MFREYSQIDFAKETIILNVSLSLKCVELAVKANAYRVSQKKYAKLIKRSLRLITSINDMLLFSDFAQSNLNFELSFVENHQVLREIWLKWEDRTGYF